MNGMMITARRSGKYITCNVSHFKVMDPGLQGEESNDEEEEDTVSSPNSNLTTTA